MQAYVLENEYLKVVVIPEAGAKIYKFVFKPTGHDFAWHSPITKLKKPKYGSSFIPYDSGGFDEMLPTVGECDFKGKHLPDHGEAWQVPWKVTKTTKQKNSVSLTLEAAMKASPFRVVREIMLKSGYSQVLFNYTITNTGSEPWEYLWALHGSVAPGGKIDTGDKIFLPAGTKVNVWWSKDDRLGKQGAWHTWPLAKDASGKNVNLSVMGKKELGFADKLFTDAVPEGWVAALDIRTRESIGFVFPKEKLPYVGIWIDQGGWRGYNQLGLEATNGQGDALDAAVNDYLQTYGKLQPKQSEKFTLWTGIVKGLKSIQSVTKNGVFIEKPIALKGKTLTGSFGFPVQGTAQIYDKMSRRVVRQFLISPVLPLPLKVSVPKDTGSYVLRVYDVNKTLLDEVPAK